MSNEIQWTLGECFAREPLAGVVNKKLFGGYEISGLNVMFASMWVFQKGAVLGRARADRMKILAQLVATEGKEESMCVFFRETTERTLTEYGKEPNTFLDFLQKTTFSGLDMTNIKTLKALHNKKYRLGEILPRFQVDVATGIGFGAIRPELVQKMWIQSYETEKDPDVWAEARRHGVDLPEKQTYVTLAQVEAEVLEEVREFLTECKPHLVEPLGL